MPTNWKQLKAIEAKNKKRILEICPSANDESGIYVFLRYEGEFKYAYIGQAKHLLTRLAQHLNGYQHIDLSIKRHGLYSEENPTGWQVVCANYPEDALDDTERQLIATYANKGYQLRNKTAGGQDSGKFGIDDNRPAKGYYEAENVITEEVTFKNGTFCFKTSIEDITLYRPIGFEIYEKQKIKCFEVIGNIHDNPELLEQE